MNEAPFKSSTLRYKLLDFPTNIRLGWQYLPETNTRKSVNYGQKMFYNIGPRLSRLLAYRIDVDEDEGDDVTKRERDVTI